MSRIAPRDEKKVVTDKPNRQLLAVLGMTIILIFTFFVYHSVTTFDSTNWDDKAFMQEAPLVRDINLEKIKQIFKEKFLKSYNPVVLLTFAFDYEMSKLKPAWSHGVNLFFHLSNIVLLFFCFRLLKFKNQFALILTFIFAIHPLSTEAIAWIAGRKDVVYLFFFLFSWMSYLKFYRTKKAIYFILSVLFFVISLLSKVQALTLPFILIISDLMLDNKFELKRLRNKIPFILLSLVFGIIAISGGGELVADKYAESFSIFDKLIYSVMAFGKYLVMVLLPFNQIAIHQFPVLGTSKYTIDLIVGIFSIICVATVFIRTYKKNPRVAGGVLFFVVCIFPVLHIVAVNSAIIYERFTYLAAIGIFMAIFAFLEKKPRYEIGISYTIICLGLMFSVLTYARIPVWKNSISLWSDVIKKDPTVPAAFMNRGQYYEQTGETDKAFNDFTEVITLAPKRPDGYHNRAVIYFQKKDMINALLDNEKALLIDPENTDALVNRGDLYFNLNKNDSAIMFYKKAISISPDFAKAYYDCGSAYFKLGNHKAAIENYTKAISIIPDFHDAFVYMAISYINIDSVTEAKLAINKAEQILPNSAGRTMVSSELLKLGNSAFAKNKIEESLRLYLLAAEISPSNAEAYYNLGGIYFYKKNNNLAKENWQKALKLKPDYSDARIWLDRIAPPH